MSVEYFVVVLCSAIGEYLFMFSAISSLNVSSVDLFEPQKSNHVCRVDTVKCCSAEW